MGTNVDIRHYIEAQTRALRRETSFEKVSLIEKVITRKITDREKAEFCTQLSVMLQSRISIHRALQSLSRQVSNRRLNHSISELLKDIQKGNSFAQALSHQSHIFDNLFTVTVEVGQESGRLAEVLGHLARHLEKMNALRRKFLQALTYPALVIGVACLAVAFLLLFIVPTFAEMFKNFQVDLPTTTKIVLSISEVLTHYGMYGLIALLCFAGLFWKTLTSPLARQRVEMHTFKLPVLGDILVKNHVARFCRTLGTLLQAQVSLVDALEVTQRIVTNAELKKDIREILKQVKQGKTIAEPIVDSSLFPPMVSQMIAVGEETSELDSMLLKVADYYEKELDSKVESLSSVIEPILILILGLIVAAILISMYLPMFDLVNVVGGSN